jgi:hypothetical protein
MKSIRLFFGMLLVAIIAMSNTVYGNTGVGLFKELQFDLQENQKVVQFSQSPRLALPSRDQATQNLLSSGFTQDFIDNLSENALEQIAQYDMAVVSMKYYTEELDRFPSVRNEAESRMIEITSEEFIKRSGRNSSTFSHDVITIVDDNGVVLHDPNAKSSFQPFNITSNVDGGTLQVTTAIFGVSGIQSQYCVVSEYIWSKMPSYRGTDFFGITRDNNTVIIPNAWENYYAYESDTYSLVAPGNGGAVIWSYLHSNSYPIKNIRNEDALNPSRGFAIRMNIPNDVIPSVMLAGSVSRATIQQYARGGVYYQGALQQPSIRPTYFNHWSTYQHQKGTAWLSSPSISVPLGASITVSPVSSYSAPIVDTILASWR